MNRRQLELLAVVAEADPEPVDAYVVATQLNRSAVEVLADLSHLSDDLLIRPAGRSQFTLRPAGVIHLQRQGLRPHPRDKDEQR